MVVFDLGVLNLQPPSSVRTGSRGGVLLLNEDFYTLCNESNEEERRSGFGVALLFLLFLLYYSLAWSRVIHTYMSLKYKPVSELLHNPQTLTCKNKTGITNGGVCGCIRSGSAEPLTPDKCLCCEYRGTSLIINRLPPRATIGP